MNLELHGTKLYALYSRRVKFTKNKSGNNSWNGYNKFEFSEMIENIVKCI